MPWVYMWILSQCISAYIDVWKGTSSSSFSCLKNFPLVCLSLSLHLTSFTHVHLVSYQPEHQSTTTTLS